MSILLDYLKNNPEGECYEKKEGKDQPWFISKYVQGSFTFRIMKNRLKDAFLVLTGKAQAYHYWGDFEKINTNVSKEIDEKIKHNFKDYLNRN